MNLTNVTRRRRSNISLLFLLIVLSPLVLTPPPTASAWGAGSGHKKEDKQDPCLAERAIGYTGLNTRWDALRAWAKLAWMNIRPPDASHGQGSATGNVKEAAARSFETSKETVQHTAESAAKVAGQAAEKTREKLTGTSSSQGDAKSEL